MTDILKWNGITISTGLTKYDGITISTGLSKWNGFDFPSVCTAGDRGIMHNGSSSSNVSIDYITILSTGNAADFGDYTTYGYRSSSTSNGGCGRGITHMGRVGSSDTNIINYITISTPGDGADFGDLSYNSNNLAACSNGTNDRGIFGRSNIDYVTISTTGNSTNFGSILTGTGRQAAGLDNGTNNRGVFGGGYTGVYTNEIEYITISTTGNTTDFGDLIESRNYAKGVSNGTNNRGCIAQSLFSGEFSSRTIDYITISSTGNANDFGDLTESRANGAHCDNKNNNRGVFSGGSWNGTNSIDYITISTIGNATDFGDAFCGNYAWGAGMSNA